MGVIVSISAGLSLLGLTVDGPDSYCMTMFSMLLSMPGQYTVRRALCFVRTMPWCSLEAGLEWISSLMMVLLDDIRLL